MYWKSTLLLNIPSDSPNPICLPRPPARHIALIICASPKPIAGTACPVSIWLLLSLMSAVLQCRELYDLSGRTHIHSSLLVPSPRKPRLPPSTTALYPNITSLVSSCSVYRIIIIIIITNHQGASLRTSSIRPRHPRTTTTRLFHSPGSAAAALHNDICDPRG